MIVSNLEAYLHFAAGGSVPEPTGAILLASSLSLLLGCRRRPL